LYRFLQPRGLTTRQLLAAPGRKKFEAEFSNQMWQSDLLFGPYVERPGGGIGAKKGPKKAKKE
jgi:hypothetical protein